jgi:hypothetical protein
MDSGHEREVRAARNESLFRAVNERIEELNQALALITGTFDITCECADMTCIETISIRPFDYHAIRGNPRQFAVLPGHVIVDIERIVQQTDTYTVVEKLGAAGVVATEAAEHDEQITR